MAETIRGNTVYVLRSIFQKSNQLNLYTMQGFTSFGSCHSLFGHLSSDVESLFVRQEILFLDHHS